ncbi:MAG TPA: ABC transporter permease [Thermoanaerobaculia bacterium]|jgi:putative ABC transport system permease protein|nr:ABC transporter permease [Thermoanaerobaculia bacterium]
MTRHLLKLVWNRKRTNALIILEIFFSFLVLFVVGTLGLYLWDNVRRPLGFSYDNVWVVSINMQRMGDDTFDPSQVETAKRALAETQALPPVEAAAGAMLMPYSLANYIGRYEFGGRPIDSEFNEVTLDYDKVMGLQLVQGRWFEKADEALSWRPVVINAAMAKAVFGDADPIGKRFGDPSKDHSEPERRVIGVVTEFRRGGEFAGSGNYTFLLKRLSAGGSPPGNTDRPPQKLAVRVKPGTPVEFEEQLARRLQAVAPEWSFEVKPLAQMRRSSFRLRLTPLIAGGVVAVFLMLMVGLGLIGVLWQNLLQRTREIGLRRASGASRADVHAQVLWEQAILTSFGVLLGTILVAQIPLLDLVGFIRPQIFVGGIVVAMVSIYLLAALCALYPSAMAARVLPAEALRYE